MYRNRIQAWGDGVFCREKSERYGPRGMPRNAMAGEFAGVTELNFLIGTKEEAQCLCGGRRRGDGSCAVAGSVSVREREREMCGKRRANRGMSGRASGESDGLTSWGENKINKYLADFACFPASLSAYFSPYLRLCFRLSSNGASLPFTRRLLLHISPSSSNPSLWLTSILPLIPRGSSSPSPTIQEIPNPISLINSQTSPTPQSCPPSRTTSNRNSRNSNPSLPLALSPRMTNIPRSSPTSPPPQNPTNPAMPSPRLPFSQNSTR